MKNWMGYSLIEILIVLVMIGILSIISIPMYAEHITHTKRLEAEISLYKLSTALENYYLIHNTYQHANLNDLKIIPLKDYQLEISLATDTEYTITAYPKGDQEKNDTECAILKLNSSGIKSITGSSQLEDCW